MTEKKETESRGERRSETARRNDDSDITSAKPETPDQQGRSGGNLQKDIGTQAALERVRDPDASEGPTKSDEIAHGQDTPSNPGRGDV